MANEKLMPYILFPQEKRILSSRVASGGREVTRFYIEEDGVNHPVVQSFRRFLDKDLEEGKCYWDGMIHENGRYVAIGHEDDRRPFSWREVFVYEYDFSEYIAAWLCCTLEAQALCPTYEDYLRAHIRIQNDWNSEERRDRMLEEYVQFRIRDFRSSYRSYYKDLVELQEEKGKELDAWYDTVGQGGEFGQIWSTYFEDQSYAGECLPEDYYSQLLSDTEFTRLAYLTPEELAEPENV